MKHKVIKEYLSTTGTHRKAGQIVHVSMPSKHTEDLVRFGFLEKLEKAKPIKSKLANLLIAPEDYIEGEKKHGRLDPELLTKNLGLDKKGYVLNGSLYGVGSSGYYWSRTVDSGNSQRAYNLYFNSSTVFPADNFSRYYDFSVRCVKELEG